MSPLNLRLARTLALPLALLASTFASTFARAAAPQAPSATAAPPPCAGCHEERVSTARYESSVHADLDCTACHRRDDARPAPTHDGKTCTQASVLTTCASCHETQVREHTASVHDDERLPIPCTGCHSDIHGLATHRDDKLHAAKLCVSCHERQRGYFDSTHHEALVAGSADAATCTDCHGHHTVAKVDNDAKGRVLHTQTCLRCHDDREKMERNEVALIAGETYFHSFHGKNVRLGYPEKVAGCADCHGSHLIREADDVRSAVHEANLVDTCSKCHGGASASFVQYDPHADDRDREGAPALYWTRIAMTTLLVGAFGFFWVHSVLWALRSFVERRTQGTPRHHPPATPGKAIRRFTPTQIVLHLVVVVSFLALALTGLPLKFAGTGWGQRLMGALGGADRARLIHHTAAVITFGYFAVALVMSYRFLFRTKTGERWTARLLGPDSLFPNLRDWADFKAMVRWFAFKGPKPTFERWTYWEKFDFLAVFWGMVAIGLSGLMLWFPVAAAQLVPGWVFNLATIVHSDEALLATGFIFTVHFFNTHFRPEKFPMDTVIFDGRVTEAEFKEERGDQWRRYEAEGRLDSLVVDGQVPLVWAIAYRIIGASAVIIGLGLAAAMALAMLAS